MELGLDVSQHQLEWDEILRRTRFAEEAGFADAGLSGHLRPLYADPERP